MLQRFTIILFTIALAGTLAASSTIEITGSTTIYPILKTAAESFMNLHPNIRITVEGTGSSVGVSGILEGRVDIGAASREIKQKELDRAAELNVKPYATVIAMDGIAVVVHPGNPVNALSLDQIHKIYTGDITNWSQVGGENKPIHVVSRDDASGTFEVFHKIVMGDDELFYGALIVASNAAVVEVVQQSDDAIGFVGVGYLNATLKPLLVDGETPTPTSIRSRHYKLARALNLYTDGEPTGDVAAFIDYLLSPEGQRIVQSEGFVPMR